MRNGVTQHNIWRVFSNNLCVVLLFSHGTLDSLYISFYDHENEAKPQIYYQ